MKQQVLDENIMVMMVWRSYESENLRKVDLNRDYGRKEGGRFSFCSIQNHGGAKQFPKMPEG